MVSKSETSGAPNSRFVTFELVSETGSTNQDLIIRAAKGAPEGSVLIAEHQTAGKGRQGRSWMNADGSLLAVSWLMRPKSAPSTWGLIPLMTGLAAVTVVQGLGVPAKLKWPNDVLVGSKKLAGILCESSLSADPAVIIGMGMNIAWESDLAPAEIVDIAVSLADYCEVPPAPVDLARKVLTRFETLWQNWHGADGASVDTRGLLEQYEPHCVTLDQTEISFSMIDGTTVVGKPLRIHSDGGLVVKTADGEQTLTAGDAHHIRT